MLYSLSLREKDTGNMVIIQEHKFNHSVLEKVNGVEITENISPFLCCFITSEGTGSLLTLTSTVCESLRSWLSISDKLEHWRSKSTKDEFPGFRTSGSTTSAGFSFVVSLDLTSELCFWLETNIPGKNHLSFIVYFKKERERKKKGRERE